MRSESMHARLCAWGAWFNAGGCNIDGGWPVKSVLHPTWQPPTFGARAAQVAVKRSDVAERELHDRIGRLSDKLRAAVVVVYARPWAPREKAAELGCTVAAMERRIDRAHEALASRVD